jgi:hypothetical protein
MPQSSPDFPIPLPGEHRFGENFANLHQQFVVAAHLGTTFLRLFSLLLSLPSGIEAGPPAPGSRPPVPYLPEEMPRRISAKRW